MFSRLTRLALRRCMHTASGAAHAAPRLNRASRVALGASVVVTAYISWNLASERSKIHLDSLAKPSVSKPSPAPPTPTTPPPPPPPTTTTKLTPEPATPSESTSSTPIEGNVPQPGDVESTTEGSSSGGGGGGAYNPETGEINWDCPCLGGMAQGPCGEQFKEAFSCFVFSEEEPKGINCVDAFKKMQDCFREHPEVYADEIMDDDDDEPQPSRGPLVGDAPDKVDDATESDAPLFAPDPPTESASSPSQ